MAVLIRGLSSKSYSTTVINTYLKMISNSIHPATTIPHRTISNFWPQKVANFGNLVLEARKGPWWWQLVRGGDKRHWFVLCGTNGYEFATEHALLNFYIKTLAKFVGSEKEAKQKIYLVSVSYPFGFGAEIDEDTQKKLRGKGSVGTVIEDCYYATRNKDPSARSIAQFIPVNMNHRLQSIFSYHHLSKRNSEWKSDHWLIIPKEPDGGFNSNTQLIHFCIKMLADVVGSEKQAKERIYIIWYDMPFGFAAKINAETSNKLKDLPDVLQVLPDYAFDLKRNDEALMISSSSHGSSFCYYCLSQHDHLDCEYWDTLLDEDADDSTSYLLKFDHLSNPSRTVDSRRAACKHWFVSMQKPCGEFASVQQLIDLYIQTLAIAVGSEERAKGKIYRIKCDGHIFGFAAEFGLLTSIKLLGAPGVLEVIPDYLFDSREVQIQDTVETQVALRPEE